jgi:hypothetical protein
MQGIEKTEVVAPAYCQRASGKKTLYVSYVYWRLLPPLSQVFCRVGPAGGANPPSRDDGAISTNWHQHLWDSIAHPANQIPASWLKYW